MPRPTIATIGFGAMAGALFAALEADDDAPRIGACLLHKDSTRALPSTVTRHDDVASLVAARPALAVECANHAAVRDAVPVLLAATAVAAALAKHRGLLVVTVNVDWTGTLGDGRNTVGDPEGAGAVRWSVYTWDNGAVAPGRLMLLADANGTPLALLPPAALIVTGLAGLSGYTNLAAVMLEDLAIAIAILSVLALLLGVLHDFAEGIAMRIRDRDPAQAYFVRQNFIRPVKNLSQIALVAVAVVAAAWVFEWTSETVVISEALAVWNHTLFTVGGTSYSIGHALIAIAAFALVFWIAAWSRRVTYTVVLRKVKDIGIRQSLSVFAQYVVIVLGVLLTLTAVGFDVTTLTVFAASLGVGIGFGLQNVVNNFISGILLLVERPLRLGDIVTVGGASGTVSQIGIRSMRMRTFDEFDLIVPNSALISDTFTNWTRSNSLMRVILAVGISYNDDPPTAIRIIEEILGEHPGIAPNPAPMVTVEQFGASSVDLRLCYYIDLRGSYSGFVTKSEVLTKIRDRFAEAGLSIPFPQRDVHIIPAKIDGAGQPEVIEGTAHPRRRVEQGWQGDAVEMVKDDSDDDT